MNVAGVKAGRQLDGIISEKIFGVKPVVKDDGFIDLPCYSTDIKDAWNIILLFSEYSLWRDSDGVSCDLSNGSVTMTVYGEVTEPLAICKAALKFK